MLAGRPSLKQVSDLLGLPPRTLQFRLHEEGTFFQRVFDQIRLENACTRLESDTMPVAQIASELGYLGAAAFSKSFKRWTGVSPRAYRKANRDVQ